MQQKGQMFSNYEKKLEHVVVHRKGFVAHISEAQSSQIAVQTFTCEDIAGHVRMVAPSYRPT